MGNLLKIHEYFAGLAADRYGVGKHFFTGDLEDLYQALPTDIAFPAMALGRYDFSYEDNGADNVFKRRNYAFYTVHKVRDISDELAKSEAMDKAEADVDYFLNRMAIDGTYPQHPEMADFDWNTVECTPFVVATDGLCCYMTTVIIRSIHNRTI
jgi:hypothetical protein